jgi:hypothetical protein
LPGWRAQVSKLFTPSNKCYVFAMTTAEDIEKAIEQLSPHELARFRAWFEAFDTTVRRRNRARPEGRQA